MSQEKEDAEALQDTHFAKLNITGAAGGPFNL